MLATRDMNRQALLNCDDEDDAGNGAIKEFYMRNLHLLKLHPMSSIPSPILNTISVLLHNTLLFHNEWQNHANQLGVTDYVHLAKIQAYAKASQSQEIYTVLKCAIPHKSFAYVISFLINLERYDILKIIQSDVEKFLARNATTEVKKVASVHKPSSDLKAKELTNTVNIIKGSDTDTTSLVKNLSDSNTASSPSLLDKHDEQEVFTLQQNPLKQDFTDEIQDNVSISVEPPLGKNLAQKINLFPSALDENALTVFIQHCEIDSCLAKNLAATLRDEGIIVRTLSDMNNLIVMDNARKALTTVFRQVDFIIPIVSETFLQQINADSYDDYLESKDAMDNRWLYQLIENEYINNRCVNFRVRPVIVPNMNRRRLINDVILSYAFRLWSEVPKLIRVLKETKVVISEYSQVIST